MGVNGAREKGGKVRSDDTEVREAGINVSQERQCAPRIVRGTGQEFRLIVSTNRESAQIL